MKVSLGNNDDYACIYKQLRHEWESDDTVPSFLVDEDYNFTVTLQQKTILKMNKKQLLEIYPNIKEPIEALVAGMYYYILNQTKND